MNGPKNNTKLKSGRINSRPKPVSPKKNSADNRIRALFFLIIAAALIIAGKLYSLQVSAHEYYKDLAENEHSIFRDLVPVRGQIYIRDGNGTYPVAVDKSTQMAYAVPKEISDPDGEAGVLAPILGLPERDLAGRLGKPNDMYEVLAHRLSSDQINKINALKLDGIHLEDESYRYYPADQLASNVLGFVGWQGNNFGGRYGLEAYYDSELAGTTGQLQQNRDSGGGWIFTGQKEITDAEDGDSLVLSIDHSIQYEAEKIIESAINKYQADQGTIIVMQPDTGRVLAMASFPNFDPNNYQSVNNMQAFRNLAVSDTYEPGSIFKTITMAAGIDAGKITPETTYTDTGAVKIAGYTIRNALLKAYGLQTMTQVLDMSLNTGAIYAEQQTGNQNFANYVHKFGFGVPTGIDLPGEASGTLANLGNTNRDIQFYTASFGQGITVTPIQIAAAYNAIANGGLLMKPEMVQQMIRPDGSTQDVAPQDERRVVSQNTANEVGQMLRDVVVNGEGKMAGVPGYLVVGKTGTAQVASRDTKGYAQGEEIGSFAGFAPLNNPQYTLLVRIDNPRTVSWAESSAAPTFGEMMKFLLDYGNIPPTEKYTQSDLDAFAKTHTLSQDFLNNGCSNNNGNNGSGCDNNNSGNNNGNGNNNADTGNKKD
ncbi:MAG: penicillin-binding protein 2 [Candidatus Pacebacteria bacterium]|nr:penicillin-binding protein 2 [Candidatus Paceibacterota bacterium]MDR3583121.1 penicillin-binding protein 2 [Candidatus Paceibacterota bacterium]